MNPSFVTRFIYCSSRFNFVIATSKIILTTPLRYLLCPYSREAPTHTGHGHGVELELRYYSTKSRKSSSRSYRRRVNRRLKLANQPKLNQALFNDAVSHLPPRFTPDHLHDVIVLQDDPLVCLELFTWASSQNPRFRHTVNTYHVTIQKLGAAKMYEEMDAVVNQVLAYPHIASEPLYNTMIYYFTEARKLTRAVNIFKHMKDSRNLNCIPSIRTYNLLFTAFLSRRTNTYVNHMYMETMRCLFRQLVNDGIDPDIITLNCMIKGYVLSNHVNDALVIFHQMGVVYSSRPNAMSYDSLIHGLCAQGRTRNARELCDEMQQKGFVLSAKTYNSLVNALSLNGEVEDAACYLWEMVDKKKPVDFITCKTIVDQICRNGKDGEAFCLLHQLREKGAIDVPSYKKLLFVLEDDFDYGGDCRQLPI